MLTFLEFYQTLLQFVNYKLYHSLSVRYPPVLDSKLEEAAAGLASIMQDIAQHQPHKPRPQPVQLPDQQTDSQSDTAAVDVQALPAAVQERLQDGQEAAAAASDDEDEDEVGEIDSGDDDDADVAASSADEEDAAAAPGSDNVTSTHSGVSSFSAGVWVCSTPAAIHMCCRRPFA